MGPEEGTARLASRSLGLHSSSATSTQAPGPPPFKRPAGFRPPGPSPLFQPDPPCALHKGIWQSLAPVGARKHWLSGGLGKTPIPPCAVLPALLAVLPNFSGGSAGFWLGS